MRGAGSLSRIRNTPPSASILDAAHQRATNLFDIPEQAARRLHGEARGAGCRPVSRQSGRGLQHPRDDALAAIARKMAVAHDALMARLGLQNGMLCQKLGDL